MQTGQNQIRRLIHGLHHLSLIQQFLDRWAGIKMNTFEVKDKFGEDVVCPNS